ncbi:MAG: decaprenyl-phosphate phosphoribosyltransferase [Myxococcaceae bacterium]|jgi:4-hydroxybenzoate polyprenyltransferase|nr:decaprenyl-phosphate phosphoribosyltransferase [Myxococcaceae bacterium]MCA3011810.1 decaprenyl-phosphate phosphoribosyltransferase [Myxococcaceae bacterium]
MDAPSPPTPRWPVAALKALRPRQWTKNGVLLAPLIFAKSAFQSGLVFKAFVAVAAFSLLASGVYVVNDWVDREKDRLHPEKRRRPIAAGHLGLGSAITLVALCWGGAAGLGAWLGLPFVGVLGGYLALQAVYTGGLKHAVLLDVMAIALGFILRVVAGAVAIDVVVSNWLFLCTLLGAVFLGFAKRRAELSSLEEAAAHRANLADYTVPMLDQMMSIAAASTVLAYGLYTVSPETVAHVGSDRLKFTVPCVIYGVFRYVFLVHKRGQGGAPEKVLLGDGPIQLTVLAILGLAAWALYFPG